MARKAKYPLDGYRRFLLTKEGLQPKTALVYVDALRRMMMRVTYDPSQAQLEAYDQSLDQLPIVQSQFRCAWRYFVPYVKIKYGKDLAVLKKKIRWVQPGDRIYTDEYYRLMAPLLRDFSEYSVISTRLIADVRTSWLAKDSRPENAEGAVLRVTIGKVRYEHGFPKHFRWVVRRILELCHPAQSGLPRDDRYLFQRIPDSNKPMFAGTIQNLILSVGGSPILNLGDERVRQRYKPSGVEPTYLFSGPIKRSYAFLYDPDAQKERNAEGEAEAAPDAQ